VKDITIKNVLIKDVAMSTSAVLPYWHHTYPKRWSGYGLWKTNIPRQISFKTSAYIQQERMEN